MNLAETKWLDDLGDYEQMGGYIPEDIRASMFYAFCTNNWDIEIYGRTYNIQRHTFREAIAWIEENGPDLPTPLFGL